MIRVGIIGASGYTGLELVRLLLDHPQAKVTYLASKGDGGKDLNEIYPGLKGHFSMKCEDFVPERALAAADFFFLAMPHGLSGEMAPKLLKPGKKVVDIGSDFRLDDDVAYETWYKMKAAKKPDVPTVYGLPEMNGDAVKGAVLVANPGCFPTATVLGLLPLVRKGLIETRAIVVDAKTGVSGAGRTPSIGNLLVETNENMKAYKVGAHQHTPEIEQALTQAAGGPVTVAFTTHLMPLSRGILATCYGRLKVPGPTTTDLLNLYRETYREEPFVQVMPEGVYPGTKDVLGSNTCMIGLKMDARIGTVIVTSVIDNLTKGASGQAIQNMNLMCGLDETTGLPRVGLIP
jgi:N-acetyl-gamma-glutamyl-phosphate reductase